MTTFDCRDQDARARGMDEAVHSLSRGGLVVLPTDTVYGIAANAFDARAVAGLLAAKGRGREKPPPVLVADPGTLTALTTELPDAVRALTERFWPGALTLICRAQPTLMWDLGETAGTVALRMPDHPLTLALLRRTGPLAVSSANTTSAPAATTAQEAVEALGASVSVYLDDGGSPGGTASTIIDATSSPMRVVRQGALSFEALREVVPDLQPLVAEPADVADESRGGDVNQ